MPADRIISINALVGHLMRKRRIVVVFGLLFAVIMGGAKFYQERKAEGVAVEGQSAAVLENDFSYKAEIDRIREDLIHKNAYLHNSIKGQIDPTNVGLAFAYLTVNTGDNQSENLDAERMAYYFKREWSDEDEPMLSLVQSITKEEASAYKILDQYSIFVSEKISLQSIAEELGTDPLYIREILKVEEKNGGGLTLKISAQYIDEEGAERILTYVLNEVESQKRQIEEEWGEHTIFIDEVYTTTVIDTSMFSWRNSRLQEIINLNNNMKAYSSNTEQFTNAKHSVTTEKISWADILKRAVLGFIAGSLLYSIGYALYLVISQSVLSADELSSQFHINKIAIIPKRIEEKKRSDIYGVVNEKIRAVINKGAERVALVSDVDMNSIIPIKKELELCAKDNSFSYVPISFKEIDLDTMRELAKCDVAIIVAETLKSKYPLIRDTINELDLQKIPVLGIIAH